MNEASFNLQRLALELIAAKRPCHEILDQLCALVQQIMPNGRAMVMRLCAERKTLTSSNAPDVPVEVLAAFGELTPGPLSGSCGSSVYERKMVAVENTATDPRWQSLRAVAESYNIRSCWSAPIFVAGDEIVGAFAISRSVVGLPTEQERRLLELAAYLAGIALRLDQAEVDARDLTEHRRVERAMQHAEKLESLGVLVGGIAHDFNNLLVGVLANVGLLEDDRRIVAGDLRDSLADIRMAVERAVELTCQFLHYAGKREPNRQELDLAGVLGEMTALLAGALPKNVRLNTQLSSNLPVVEADPVQVRQVLMNLIINASESYGDGRGEIRVVASKLADGVPSGCLVPSANRERGDWLEIEVSDYGCGMDGATLARIFDPFFSTKMPGRGLGLAAVLGIVGSHGGCMDVESRVGAGTTIRIWLPTHRDQVLAHSPSETVTIPSKPPQSDASPADSMRGHAVSRGSRALVVEDEPAIGKVIARILARGGFETVVAQDGPSGLDAFVAAGDAGFDIVIVDYTMPGFDGRELACRIRKRDLDVPIVLTSGLGEVDAVGGHGEWSVDAFLSKPFASQQVMHAIDEAVSRRQLVRARSTQT